MTAPTLTRRFACEPSRSEEHTSELQSHLNLVCRLLLEKKNLAVGSQQQDKQPFQLTPPIVDQFQPVGSAIAGQPFFFFNDTATTEIYTLSLHDALPI